MRLQAESYVALLFIVAAVLITGLLYNLVYPHIKNINPTGQSIAEALKINFQLLNYFIQNNTLYAYVEPSEPVNASQVFAIVNNQLVYVYPLNSNSTIVNPYNNGLLLIVANLSQIPPDQNGNYKIAIGLENDVMGIFTIQYTSDILRQFFKPVNQFNLTIPSQNVTEKPFTYYSIILYNTQNIPTPQPFQQDIAICNGSTTRSSYFNILGSNSGSGRTSKSINLPAGGNLYLCNGADGSGYLSSYSWISQEEDSNGYSNLGFQSSNTCSDSSNSTDIVVGGVAINTTEYEYFQGTNFDGVNSFSYQYNLYNTSNVVISISCGYYGCTTINVPAGCKTLFDTSGKDGNETSFAAVCYNQSAGSYTISGNLNGAGYVSLGLYQFSPILINPGFSYIDNQTLYNLINFNGSNVYFFSNTNNPKNSLLYSWYEGQENIGQASCDIWWLNISNGIPANSNYTIYMHLGNISDNYYSQYYPYVGASPQVINGYDNGNYTFISYGYFNNTFDGWSGYQSQYANTSYIPVATPNGIEMLNNNTIESTYILPYNNGNIPEIPLILEEAWYYSGTNNGYSNPGDANAISLFGNTNEQILAGDVSFNGGVGTPASNYSTFSQFEYVYYPPSNYPFSYNLLSSAYLNYLIGLSSFTYDGGTFYSYLIVNNSYAQSGWYQYNPNQVWAPLTLLDSYSIDQDSYTYSSLNYNPQYPTIEIGAGTGYGASYQYIQWAIARAYPPNGVMPEIFIQ